MKRKVVAKIKNCCLKVDSKFKSFKTKKNIFY